MHKPTTLHFQYLKSIINHELMLLKPTSEQWLAYTDANQGENFDDRTSASTFLIFFGGSQISWMSKEQCTIARSSTEAKQRVVATTTTVIMWLKNLLTELQVPMHEPPQLLCDNLGATYLCSNMILHSCMKHISLDYHFVREQVQAK